MKGPGSGCVRIRARSTRTSETLRRERDSMRIHKTEFGVAVEREDGSMLDVRHIIGVGRNYAAHAGEMGADLPERPLVFFKSPCRVPCYQFELLHDVVGRGLFFDLLGDEPLEHRSCGVIDLL